MTAARLQHGGVEAHRVASKLWVGSSPQSSLAGQGIDLLVLCAMEDQGARDVPTLRVPLDDSEAPMSRAHIVMAVDAARQINRYRANGRRVLVTCRAGVNRSSFVAAIALIDSGWTASGAIDAIRDNRKPLNGMVPISNRRFEAMLRAFGSGRLHAYGGIG